MIPPVPKLSGFVILLSICPAGLAQSFCRQASNPAHIFEKNPWGAAVGVVVPGRPGAAPPPGAPPGIPPGTCPADNPAARRTPPAATPVRHIHFMIDPLSFLLRWGPLQSLAAFPQGRRRNGVFPSNMSESGWQRLDRLRRLMRMRGWEQLHSIRGITLDCGM
jgi:hypothetical protein